MGSRGCLDAGGSDYICLVQHFLVMCCQNDPLFLRNSLLRDQMRIHMHMRKPVLAAGRSDLLDLEDDRDCQREQPAALAQAVVDNCTLQPVRSGIQTTAPLDSAISAR